MTYKVVEIGLPFYDVIEKQLNKKVYFNSHLTDWLTKENRLPPFQFYNTDSSGIGDFDLVNFETGASISLLTYFNTNVAENVVDGKYYYTHVGRVDIALSVGRFYLYARNVSRSMEWWSEVFTVCEGSENTDRLLISNTDYLLLDGTDRLLI